MAMLILQAREDWILSGHQALLYLQVLQWNSLCQKDITLATVCDALQTNKKC